MSKKIPTAVCTIENVIKANLERVSDDSKTVARR